MKRNKKESRSRSRSSCYKYIERIKRKVITLELKSFGNLGGL